MRTRGWGDFRDGGDKGMGGQGDGGTRGWGDKGMGRNKLSTNSPPLTFNL